VTLLLSRILKNQLKKETKRNEYTKCDVYELKKKYFFFGKTFLPLKKKFRVRAMKTK